MYKIVLVALGSFALGAMSMAKLSQSASEFRDRAIASTYLAEEARNASQALARRDLPAAERHQRNAIDAAERGVGAIGMDVAPWTMMFPLATGVVAVFASDADSDALVRRRQEIALRQQHADLLDQMNRGDEARAQRQKAERLEK